jgi:hypothetical protein
MILADLIVRNSIFRPSMLQAGGIFRWVKSLGRYINEKGRMVAERSIKALGERFTRDYISPRLGTITDKFLSGKIDLAVWQERMAKDLKDGYLTQYMIGRGGRQAMTYADYGRIGGHLRFEYRHLDGFAQEIAEGKLSAAQIRMRVQMYADGVRTAFYEGARAGKVDAGYTHEKRVLGPAEHCPDCVSYAAMGIQPIGFFPPPGIGSVCAHHCQCELVALRPEDAGE